MTDIIVLLLYTHTVISSETHHTNLSKGHIHSMGSFHVYMMFKGFKFSVMMHFTIMNDIISS